MLGAEPFVVFTVDLHTHHGIGTVFANLQVIGGDGIPHPLGPVLLLGLHTIDGVGHGAFCNRIGEDALLFLCVVKSERRFDIEVLDRIDVDVCITEGAPIDITVVTVAIQTCHGILAVGVASHRPGIVAVDGAHGQ